MLRLIVNPSAGGGRALRRLPAVEAALLAHGLALTVSRTRSLDHARALARDAVAAGDDVATLGGDGLAGAVAGELRGTGRVLAVLPGGRGNDFLRKLGVPDDLRRACDVAARGAVREIDLADADGRAVLGIVSAGFDSDVQLIANATRLPLGGHVYVYATVRAMSRWRPARWELEIDGEARAFTGYSVAVCNSGVFGGGMRLAPDADLQDGMLDVVLAGQIPRLRYLAILPKVFSGSHVHEPALTVLRARRVRFSADRPFDAFADGDPVGELPTTVTVQPGALRVRAPR